MPCLVFVSCMLYVSQILLLVYPQIMGNLFDSTEKQPQLRSMPLEAVACRGVLKVLEKSFSKSCSKFS